MEIGAGEWLGHRVVGEKDVEINGFLPNGQASRHEKMPAAADCHRANLRWLLLIRLRGGRIVGSAVGGFRAEHPQKTISWLKDYGQNKTV
jgi:hypothetical protein